MKVKSFQKLLKWKIKRITIEYTQLEDIVEHFRQLLVTFASKNGDIIQSHFLECKLNGGNDFSAELTLKEIQSSIEEAMLNMPEKEERDLTGVSLSEQADVLHNAPMERGSRAAEAQHIASRLSHR